MIVSVARSFGWASPSVIKSLYYDDFDSSGILYWYNDVKEQNDKIKANGK